MAPVGPFEANAWRLHDMLGNVFEWVRDCWHVSDAGVPEEAGSAWLEEGGGDCARRVIRGGSWLDGPLGVRSANRNTDAADDRGGNLGFRLAPDP